MAEEAILSVSLKDYKQKIDELRASLLSLEETSEEYQNTAAKVKDMQGKLNQVMSVGKKDTDAAAGSYNALSQQMSKLKKEWKNMEIGTKEWEDTAKQINTLNDKLKDADANVGVFSRNVGNYSQSFVDAFTQMGGASGTLAGGIGKVKKAFDALKLNPIILVFAAVALVINQISEAFKRNEDAMEELKKAVSPFKALWNGIQQLFDKIVKIIANTIEKFSKLKIVSVAVEIALRPFKTLLTALNLYFDALGKVLEKVADKFKVLEDKVLNSKVGKAVKDFVSWVEKVIEGIANTSVGKKLGLPEVLANIKAQRAEMERLKKTNKEIAEIENQINKARRDNNIKNAKDENEIARLQVVVADKAHNNDKVRLDALKKIDELQLGITERNVALAEQELELIKKKNSLSASGTEDLQAEADAQAAVYQAQIAYLNKQKELKQKESRIVGTQKATNTGDTKEIEELQKKIEAIQQTLMTEEEKITKQFNDENAKIEETFNKGLITQEQKENLSVQLLKNYKEKLSAVKVEEFWQKYEKELSKIDLVPSSAKEENLNYNLKNIKYFYDRISAFQGGDIDKRTINKEQKENAEALVTYLEGKRQVLERVIKEFNKDLVVDDNSGKTLQNFAKIYDDYVKGNNEAIQGYSAEIIEAAKEYVDISRQIQEAANSMIAASMDNLNNIMDNVTLPFETRLNAVKETMSVINSLQAEDFNNQEGWEEAKAQMMQHYADKEKEILNQRRGNYVMLANGVADCFGAIADIQKANIEAEKENLIKQGKSEEEANALLEDKFENMKKMQIAQAVINTITGAIAAFMSCQELGFPWGTIIGAVQAAAVTAAGVAQIKQIKNTKIGSTGDIQTSAAVTPKLNDYSPDRVSNITSSSDEQNLQDTLSKTNIWVSVSDIDNAQNKNQVRVAEASF